jgi:hypothetical protein
MQIVESFLREITGEQAVGRHDRMLMSSSCGQAAPADEQRAIK